MPLERTLARHLPHDAARLGLRLLQPAKARHFRSMRQEKLAPFFEHRCIFIHVPKCAGTSVVGALFGQAVANHRSVAAMRMVFTAAEYRDFFKFAFVRNPWDRLVSTYHYLASGGQGAADRDWAERLIAPHADFRAFVMEGLDADIIRRAYHFRPQSQFLCRGPGFPHEMDFIGRFERIEADFAHVRDRLGIAADLPRKNLGSARPDSYRDAYDEATRARVAGLYARDIEMFGYGF